MYMYYGYVITPHIGVGTCTNVLLHVGTTFLVFIVHSTCTCTYM